LEPSHTQKEERPLSTLDGHNLVFIVGCPRSGTSWLQRLLASHPSVKTGQESFVFSRYVGPLLRNWHLELDRISTNPRGAGLRNYLSDDEFRDALRRFMLELLAPMAGTLKEGELFVEKTPAHALFMREINELLPRSRFIHLLRDGRDVIASLMSVSKTWGREWAPTTSKEATLQWISHVRAARKSAERLPKGLFYELKYESLVARPVETLAGVAQFAGLQWEVDGIEAAVKRNDFRAPESGWTPIPRSGDLKERLGTAVEEPPGFIRKATPGSWRKDLRWDQKVQFWRIARKTMREVGYECSFPW